MDIVSSPKVGRSLPKPSWLLWEAYTKTCPQLDKNFTTAWWCCSMIACQVSWIHTSFGLTRNKSKVSQCFGGNQRFPGVWNSFPFLAWDISMHPRTDIWFLTNLYALEHVHVVQIWIMHINALKTQLMHKNVQTNPEKSQRLTQHSCCSMLTRVKFWKQ